LFVTSTVFVIDELGAGRRRRQLLKDRVLLAAQAALSDLSWPPFGWSEFSDLPAFIPRLLKTGPDPHVFGFPLAVTLIATLFIGLAPCSRTMK
jgi:hypothetical protein